MHYSGVRPLPYVPVGKTGAISRDHFIHSTSKNGVPVETLIGGKLTTCRAFGEEVADRVFQRLHVTRKIDTRDRPIPGAEDFPQDVDRWCEELSRSSVFTAPQISAMLRLVGTRTREFVATEMAAPSTNVPQTNLPIAFVDRVIEHEWVSALGDLVERRLGLVFTPNLSRETLEVLAERLCVAGRLDAAAREQAIHDCETILGERYGITMASR